MLIYMVYVICWCSPLNECKLARVWQIYAEILKINSATVTFVYLH